MGSDRPHQLIEYLRRSYSAVDGLWFMKLEEELGFDRALDFDRRVWSILPKIQARKARELLGLDSGPEALAQGLALSFEAEEFVADMQRAGDELIVTVRGCPWVKLLAKSDRLHLAVPVAEAICTITFQTWAREFGMQVDMEVMHCQQERCVLRFVPTRE